MHTVKQSIHIPSGMIHTILFYKHSFFKKLKKMPETRNPFLSWLGPLNINNRVHAAIRIGWTCGKASLLTISGKEKYINEISNILVLVL